PLTGELNRSHLIAALAEAIEETSRFRSTAAVMLVGIDPLARVNDAFGFDVADAVILDVAQRIRARLRGGERVDHATAGAWPARELAGQADR
ncbi:diguanylate cyclase, partial [Acinetobacter baumannii]